MRSRDELSVPDLPLISKKHAAALITPAPVARTGGGACLKEQHRPLSQTKACKTNTDTQISHLNVARRGLRSDSIRVRQTQQHVKLPIGRTARIVFELDAMRAECSRAAQEMLDLDVDGAEFEECAKLDDALAQAHRLLKANLRKIMLSRISRHAQAENLD